MKEAIKLGLLVALATTLVLPKRITPAVISSGGDAVSAVLGRLVPVT